MNNNLIIKPLSEFASFKTNNNNKFDENLNV